MRAAKLSSAVGSSALLLCALASASGAQERSRPAPPHIRVYSTNGAYVLTTTSYVSPVIQVSENAYVFAVSMDLDGQIQILQPDWPGISVRQLANKPLNLPNFFTGFARSTPGGLYSSSAYSSYDSYNDGYTDVRGTVIALASRAPFNLDLIESDGDWNISSVRQMIQGRTPESAAQSLAYYLGVKGEPIGHDILRFAGGRSYNSYAYSNYYSPCDMFASYAATFASRLYMARSSVDRLQASGERAAISYDLCGLPYVIIQPTTGGVRGVRPTPPRGDSTQIPRARLPRKGDERPRLPRSAANSAPEGVFPIPRRGELPQMGDVTITAPRARRNEPRPILDGYRSQPGIESVPQHRGPVERASTPRNEPAAATGVFPIRESRPEPRPEPRTSAPPPRAPDTPKSTPAPVERERPTPPPPPRETPAVTNRPAPPSKQQ